MRLKGRQARFLALLLGGWVAARVGLLWTSGTGFPPADTIDRRTATIAWPGAAPSGVFSPERLRRLAGRVTLPAKPPEQPPGQVFAYTEPHRAARLMELAVFGGAPPGSHALLRRAVYASSSFPQDTAPAPPPPTRKTRRPIEAQAYLFLRGGSGRALSSGSALGGSQAAARIAVPIAASGHVAAAARLYAPLHGKGAEAALGLDWRPGAAIPLRVSVERRQRLDEAGRSAWSAYAAGGFYRALPGSLHLDGYAQAGVVGIRARDLFVDGALRIERGIGTGRVTTGLGAGLWGAAQPGAERVDVGPRAVLHLPVADHALSLALEGRFRVAGRAQPGSGVAVTLAADL
jgi:hypothetical protein